MRVSVLSANRAHALLIRYGVGDLVAVKSGFSSGYGGEGPRGFSYVLNLLDTLGVEIEEYAVDEEVLGRVDASALTNDDITRIENSTPIRPTRWYDYLDEREYDRPGHLWREFPPVIPFAIIDSRITDLAIRFWDNPDSCLLSAYRRLEDTIRRRTGIDEHGARLFSESFSPRNAILKWQGSEQEQAGKMSLFTGAYMTYRNPRAHREVKHSAEDQLTEFLLLNHLFRLEAAASDRTPPEADDA